MQKSDQKRGGDGAGDIGSMGTYAGIAMGSATTSSTGGAGASTTGGARGFNHWRRSVARADTVQAKARRWWLALQTKIARRRSRAATNMSPSAARNCIGTEATNNGVEEVAERTMGNVAANTRPKALEDAAALSMVAVVADRAMANSADVAKGEEQATSDVRR